MALAAAHAQLKSLLLAELVKGFRVLHDGPRMRPVEQGRQAVLYAQAYELHRRGFQGAHVGHGVAEVPALHDGVNSALLGASAAVCRRRRPIALGAVG
jgi:hypothetical protein